MNGHTPLSSAPRLPEDRDQAGGSRVPAREGRDRVLWGLQILAGLAVMGIGAYYIWLGKWAIGGIIAGVGLSVLPFAAAGLVGAVVCLAIAGAGWYFGRLTVLVAVLVGVLSVVTILERVRRL